MGNPVALFISPKFSPRFLSLSYCSLLALSLTACSPSQEILPAAVNELAPKSSTSIIGGELAADHHPWRDRIIFLEGELPSGDGRGQLSTRKCSAILIDADTALSAAHCFLTPFHNPSSWVGISEDFKTMSLVLDVNSHPQYKDPKYNEEFRRFGHDLAIVELQNKFPVVSAKPRFATSDLSLSGELLVAGFGRTSEPFRNRNERSTKEKRGVSEDTAPLALRFARIPLLFAERTDLRDPVIYMDGSTVKRGACLGDSGGPVFAQSYTGAWSLVGVVSYGFNNKDLSARCTGTLGATSLLNNTQWLMENEIH